MRLNVKEIREIEELIGPKRGLLLVRYLGMPLISTKLTPQTAVDFLIIVICM